MNNYKPVFALATAFALLGLVGCASSEVIESPIRGANNYLYDNAEADNPRTAIEQQGSARNFDPDSRLFSELPDINEDYPEIDFAQRIKPPEDSVGLSPIGLKYRVISDLPTIHFAFDSKRIDASQQKNINQVLKWLMQNTDIKLNLIGHTDERGAVEYNLALGLERAESVAKYLITAGINPNRLGLISYGEEMPLDYHQTDAAWAKNRRVEFSWNKEQNDPLKPEKLYTQVQ